MQRSFHPQTPQKRTLKISYHDQHLLKELSPQLLTIGSSGYGKIKLEMLQSPLPNNKDLFSQLLQCELKMNYEDYCLNQQILEEDSYEFKEQVYDKEYTSEQDSQMIDNDYEEDQNDIKKRKRKSSAQIKILKQELEIEPNWTKEKIAQMSQITRLSQSQVYKWWWDQKKKNIVHEKDTSNKFFGKNKSIKKLYNRRSSQKCNSNQTQSDSEEQEVFTKPKNAIEIKQIPETERKVNKILSFL